MRKTVGGDGMSREERLAEEHARNPCCKECSSPTTKEVRSGVEETYEYVCSDDYCDYSELVEVTA